MNNKKKQSWVFVAIILFLILLYFFFGNGFNRLSGHLIFLERNADTVNISDEVRIGILVSDITDLAGIQLDISYDSKILSYQRIEEGNFLNEDGWAITYFNESEINLTSGLIEDIIIFRRGGYDGINGSGILATIYFNATSPGSTDINLPEVLLADSNGEMLPSDSVGTSVSVKGGDEGFFKKALNKFKHIYEKTIGDIFGDSTAPSAPTNLTTGRVTKNQVELFWNAPPEDDVAGYELYRCLGICEPEELVAVVNDLKYVDKGLFSSTTYSYAIIAYDAVPNRSPHSAILSVTTN